MRSFTAVFLVIVVSLLAAALLAYPTWLLVGLISDQPIHRVLHRVAMLVAVIGFVALFRRWAIFNRYGLGFCLPRQTFWQQVMTGLIAGTLVILPLVVTLQALGIRALLPQIDLSFTPVIKLIMAGLAAGMVVALIEEVFFRGLLFTAIRRESGTAMAVILPSLLYASLHFLGGRLYVPSDQIQWSSGLAVMERMFIKYADPAAMADSFLALFAVGVLLALVRIRTRSVAACIGLHASWVCVIAYVKETTFLAPDHSAGWLVGNYDGVLGWGALAWMGWLAVMYYMISRTAGAGSEESLGSGEQRA